ncbi:MAG: hypothetical protein FWH27_08265 [Planctomycetaceae bacterium]|nr:hypothetical protein [Planctomycetaceae bacterium]
MTKRNLLLTLLPMSVLMLSACHSSVPAQSLPGVFPAQEAVFNEPAPVQSVPELSFEQLQAIAIQPAAMNPETGSRVVPEMLSLFREEEIRYTGGTKYKDKLLKFRLHVPENMEPGKTYPLILWLHGVGEAGDDNRDQLVHLHHMITYLAGPKKRDFFLLVPQTPTDHTGWDAYSYYRTVTVVEPPQASPRAETAPTRSLSSTIGGFFGGSGTTSSSTVTYTAKGVTQTVEEGEDFGDSPLGFSFAMLEQVREKYPVDPDRITVSGLSSGGDGTWRALERGPDIFAAAVPLVSWSALKAEAIEKSPQLKKIPIWAIYSSDDNGIDQARADFARVEAAGCNVRKSEFGLCGHNAWTPAMLQADIFSWLLSRAKKDGEYIAVADSSVDPDEMQGVIEVAERDERLPTLAPPQTVVSGQLPVASNPDVKLTPPFALLVPPPPAEVEKQTSSVLPLVASPQTQAHVPVQPPMFVDHKIDELRYILASRYFIANQQDDATRIFRKLSPEAKHRFVAFVLGQSHPEQLAFIESLLDELPQIASVPTPPAAVRVIENNPGIRYTVTVPTYESPKPAETVTVSPSVRKVVEECEKEWVMSSHTLYGLFAADWNKESELVPDFVMKSTASELAQHIQIAATRDKAKFQKLCDSVLKLDNNPMSSPWFETSGGRLQSDIKYTLSPRGKVLQAVFQDLIKDQGLGKVEDADNMMQKVLDKLEMIMD